MHEPNDDQPPATETQPYGLTPAHWNSLRTRARLQAWVAARENGVWDVGVCDAIADAAVDAVRDHLMLWHEQDPVRHPATARP